jgi:arabinose-5-phosphate isomerase
MNTNVFLEFARESMKTEASAICETARLLSDDFSSVVSLILRHSGSVILCGVGKSGMIAQKIATTLTSTGTKAIFLHPTEALHGDLGIYSPGDPTLLFSRSGSTDELITLLPLLKHFQSPLVAIVGNRNSPLAKQCDFVIEAYVGRETDPFNLVPTTSAITALAVGDALAVALMRAREFQPEDFARFHPGGQLGRNLLLCVSDVMHYFDSVATANLGTAIRDVIVCMTEKPLGACCVIDKKLNLLGVITDGDIRRLVQKTENLHGIKACDVCNQNPRTISPHCKLQAAIAAMEAGQRQVNVLPVVDSSSKLLGLIRLHDIAFGGKNHHK